MEPGSVIPLEAPCRSLLQRSRMPFADFTINPYTGCAFGCSFCYVPALRRRRGQDWDTWGTWVEAKVNAEDALRREMGRIPRDARVLIGTATDPWQPAEKRLGITRSILQVLSECPNPVSVITRSLLIERDIPLLQRIAAGGGLHIGFSVSSFDDRARRVFEPRAPAIPGREHALRALTAAGLAPSLFWMPLLPGVTDNADAARAYLERAAALGLRRVMVSLLNYRDTACRGYGDRLAAYYARCRADGERLPKPALTRTALADVITATSARVGLDCRPSFAQRAAA